jgi:hypothetical protein
VTQALSPDPCTAVTPNTDRFDSFGSSVAVAADGFMAVSAAGEASAATGLGGYQSDNSAPTSGAVYVFR